MAKKRFKALRLKPNPVRQAILVGLALAGIGIGYGVGFVLKESNAPNEPRVAYEAPTSPLLANPAAQKTERTKPLEQKNEPVRSENHAGDETARAYEEALPKETIEFPALTVPPRVDSLKSQNISGLEDAPNPSVSEKTSSTATQAQLKDPAETAAEVLAERNLAVEPSEVRIDNETMPGEFSHKPVQTKPGLNKQPQSQAATPKLLTGWMKHALAVELTDRPKIAIVIDDMGVDQRRSRIAIGLRGPLTLSYLTYANRLPEQTRNAKQAGHELLLHVPMEPSSKDIDPGPNVLLSGVPAEEIMAALTWGLDQFEGFVGINNHMGSRFTSNLEGMRTVMQELRKRELIFLDSVTSGSTKGQLAAHQIGVPFIARNIFLDHIDDLDQIKKRLNEVKRLAKKQGFAVAIGHPRDATLQALGPWLETIEAEGFQLVPISALIKSTSMTDTAPAITQKTKAN